MVKKKGEAETSSGVCSLLRRRTIKQERNRVEIHRLPITVSIHELLQLCAFLDPEKHLISVLQKLVNFRDSVYLNMDYCQSEIFPQELLRILDQLWLYKLAKTSKKMNKLEKTRSRVFLNTTDIISYSAFSQRSSGFSSIQCHLKRRDVFKNQYIQHLFFNFCFHCFAYSF